MGARWSHHYAVRMQRHYVDALAGVDGTLDGEYLDEHWQYPDALTWLDEPLEDETDETDRE